MNYRVCKTCNCKIDKSPGILSILMGTEECGFAICFGCGEGAYFYCKKHSPVMNSLSSDDKLGTLARCPGVKVDYAFVCNKDACLKSAIQKLEKEIKPWADRMSLTCKRCGGQASPIALTVSRYRCIKCGSQFAGQNHGW